jgi:N-acetylglucosaminyldiphosphoundecaprenol N-acetyl-beta-D-mannosaminyltransferase
MAKSSLNAGNVLKIPFSTDPKNIILEYVQKYLSEARESSKKSAKKAVKPLVILTPNPEQVVYAQNDSHFVDIAKRADVVLPDGVGVVWALRRMANPADPTLDTPPIQKIAGVDFMQDLVEFAAEQRVPVGLIGGKPGLAVKALECLREKHPALIGFAQEAPAFAVKDFALIAEDTGQTTAAYFKNLACFIHEHHIGIVFVALGAPKQEYAIEQIEKALGTINYDRPVVLMAVGGSFEILSGYIQRAPLFIRLMGFEWFWRLSQEPWRWKRQRVLLTFVRLVLGLRPTL